MATTTDIAWEQVGKAGGPFNNAPPPETPKSRWRHWQRRLWLALHRRPDYGPHGCGGLRCCPRCRERAKRNYLRLTVGEVVAGERWYARRFLPMWTRRVEWRLNGFLILHDTPEADVSLPAPDPETAAVEQVLSSRAKLAIARHRLMVDFADGMGGTSTCSERIRLVGRLEGALSGFFSA